jgi:transcriptional regulator with XRE-family HTH domain
MLRVKHERLQRGWSQLEVAYRARVQPSELSRIERGLAVPYARQAQRLAEVFGLAPAQLTERVAGLPDVQPNGRTAT